MAWIESHQNLGRHPKLLRLASKLRINKAQSVGHLQYLWWWALDFSPTGDLSAFTPAEISAASEWTGDSDVFYNALKETGWINHDNSLHDWHQYAGKYLGGLDGQKRYRQRMSELHNSNVTVTTNLTKPNQTKPDITKTNTPKPPKGGGFDVFWQAYPKKVGKGAAFKAWAKISPSPTMIETLIAAVAKQKRSDQWQKDGVSLSPIRRHG